MEPNPTLILPIDFSHEVPSESVGLTPSGVHRIIEVFEQMYYIDKLHPAAQLVVLRNGHVVVDRVIGGFRNSSITPETPFLTFSCSKAITGICIHRLLEDGLVEIDAPIAQYWPAWGTLGKESATIRHAFLHQAGVPSPHLYGQVFLWPSWQMVTWDLAHTRAVFPPGSRTEYHLVNYGFILGKVIENVSGMPFMTYLRKVILDPLGMKNSFLPLPNEMLKRTPRLVSGAKDQNNAAWVFNLPAIRTALMPAATFHSNARGLGIFYQMLLNGGTYANERIVKPETVSFATSPGNIGYDSYMKEDFRWAYGFHLGGPEFDSQGLPKRPGMGQRSTLKTFGHFGQATCMGWADPEVNLVVAFTTNRMLSAKPTVKRWADISDAVWDAVEA